MITNQNSFAQQVQKITLSMIFGVFLWACGSGNETLPVYGERYLNEQGDTVYHHIGDFSLINQDSQIITKSTFQGKIYISDFFFTNCPNICPAMTGQKLRIYEHFKNQPEVMMLSHTVDPKRDSVSVLKEFASNIGAASSRWHFATGNQEYIHALGIKSYLLPAQEDPEAAGGFLHSDRLVLIDKKGRIRGMYSGTDKVRVNQLMKDVELLLKEK